MGTIKREIAARGHLTAQDSFNWSAVAQEQDNALLEKPSRPQKLASRKLHSSPRKKRGEGQTTYNADFGCRKLPAISSPRAANLMATPKQSPRSAVFFHAGPSFATNSPRSS